MNLYLVRHGESKGNVGLIHQGEDISLSNEGSRQVSLVANSLIDEKINFIYSSPFLRVKQSAEIISKRLKLPVEFWGLLKERRRPSEVEGLKYDNPIASKIAELTKKNQIVPDWKYSDDESFNELLQRAKNIESHLIKKHAEQNVICVSHVGMIIMIAAQLIFQNMLSAEVFWQFYHHVKFNNTGITHLTYSKERGWTLVTWNDTTHL